MSLNVSAHGAALSMIPSERHGPWRLAEYPPLDGPTVFSCFHCGGGSTMGYKLAGCRVLGGVEIDPAMMEVYRTNHHPRHAYLMSVRDFIKIPDGDLPPELFELDILDGSPPCSSFSTSGLRDKAWGEEKVFREGQAAQRLDDLFFAFIEIAARLKPRVVIAENVSGLVKGQARGYVKEIFGAFKAAGYKVQLFLLNSSRMGAPQKRERTFFLARRLDLGLSDIQLRFEEPPIPFSAIDEGLGARRRPATALLASLWAETKQGSTFKRANQQLRGSGSFFNRIRVNAHDVCQTITTHAAYDIFHPHMPAHLTDREISAAQTFPLDFNFGGRSVAYLCGMSVPPFMAQRVALAVRRQWIG